MRSPVIVIGRFALKFEQNARGRASNLYEAKLYRDENATRCALLCPGLWMSRSGSVQVMRAAKPSTDMMSLDEYLRATEAWDYMPEEDSCPFEPKAFDWGWFEGRMVALDYDPGVGGRRTYLRLRPLNELCRNRPSRDVPVIDVRTERWLEPRRPDAERPMGLIHAVLRSRSRAATAQEKR